MNLKKRFNHSIMITFLRPRSEEEQLRLFITRLMVQVEILILIEIMVDSARCILPIPINMGQLEHLHLRGTILLVLQLCIL